MVIHVATLREEQREARDEKKKGARRSAAPAVLQPALPVVPVGKTVTFGHEDQSLGVVWHPPGDAVAKSTVVMPELLVSAA